MLIQEMSSRLPSTAMAWRWRLLALMSGWRWQDCFPPRRTRPGRSATRARPWAVAIHASSATPWLPGKHSLIVEGHGGDADVERRICKEVRHPLRYRHVGEEDHRKQIPG